jgi:predicted CXXCH cytochrome family protein
MKGAKAIKRLLLVGFGSALIVTMAGVEGAKADNGPHVSSAKGVGVGQSVLADGCASCHRAHTAKGSFILASGQEGLCLTCHGSAAGGAATNVADGVGYEAAGVQNRDRSTAAGALRGGGFNNALLGSATPTKETYLSSGSFRAKNQNIPVLAAGAPSTSNHNVTGTSGTAWGNGALNSGAGASISLECGSCHNAHGNGNYRILRPLPVDSNVANTVDPVTGVSTPAVGVTIPDASVKVYTTTNYWATGDATVPATRNGLPAVAPDGFIANVSDWCTTCHTRYLAGSGSYQVDSGDAIFKFRHRSDRFDKVGAANCITCHVAHGSNASMNGYNSKTVPQPDGTAAAEHAVGAAGSRLLRVDNRGICVMCHNV